MQIRLRTILAIMAVVAGMLATVAPYADANEPGQRERFVTACVCLLLGTALGAALSIAIRLHFTRKNRRLELLDDDGANAIDGGKLLFSATPVDSYFEVMARNWRNIEGQFVLLCFSLVVFLPVQFLLISREMSEFLEIQYLTYPGSPSIHGLSILLLSLIISFVLFHFFTGMAGLVRFHELGVQALGCYVPYNEIELWRIDETKGTVTFQSQENTFCFRILNNDMQRISQLLGEQVHYDSPSESAD